MSARRRIITPEHFKLAPDLLGLPLASPSRRALAMAIDLLVVGLLVKTGRDLLGIAAALLLFRAASSRESSGLVRRSVRLALRLAGGVLIFFVLTRAWNAWNEPGASDETGAGEVAMSDLAEDAANEQALGVRDIPALAGSMIALRQAEDSAAVAAAAASILETSQRGGASADELYDMRSELIDVMGDKADTGRIAAVDAAIRRVAGARAPLPAPDSALRAYLSAVARHDSVAIAAIGDTVKRVFAGNDIAKLKRDVRRANARKDSLARELEQARKPRGIRTFLAGAMDDLGVGFGWSAVYFTAFLALWRGQTPGKRAARIRVLRLDGKPLGWSMSFERFGGYAASFSVGLMGFFQILWDRNRQGLHDKACETVVVIDSAHVERRA